ncbi:MAG: GNAT family N-acetyltransferase [Firmicutes bacterium]|nr:GNAT family N-acetyltransferase [Bacillota bacterium]
MIFETDDVYVAFTQPTDIDELVGVYNSHRAFIRHHLHRIAVTPDWMAEEIKATQDAGFWSCKVVEKSTGHVIGVLDVQFGVETYLSLLMIHRSHAHQGIGQQVYGALEDYARSHESRGVRIDVATGYDNRVWDFWVRNGFRVAENMTLEWNGATLLAVAMKKALATTENGR